MTHRPDESASNEVEPIENVSDEHGSAPDRPARKHRIPSRIPGGARTSTVALGICFVLTALLYGQVRPPAPGTVVEPEPASDIQPSDETIVPSEISVTPTFESPTPTVTGEAPSTGGQTEQTGSPTSDGSTSQESTFLPGVPVPPQLRSVVPTAPGGTGTS